MTGWAQSTVQRGQRPALAHFFLEDEDSLCGESSRVVCRGNEPLPPLVSCCPSCLRQWMAWRRIELPGEA